MSLFLDLEEDFKSRFDEDFASPADYDDGFVESDAVRIEREEKAAARARRFDFSRAGVPDEPPAGAGAKGLGLPSPKQWEREQAKLTEQYRGYTREQTRAMGLNADCSYDEDEEPGDDGPEFG